MISVETSGKFASFDLSKMSEVMKSVSEFMLDEVRENFSQDGRPKWDVHAPSTIKKYGAHPLLRLSYRMYNAIQASNTNEEAIVDGGDAVAPYGKYNHFGTFRKGKRHIPPRPFLMLPPERWEALVGVFAKEFEGKVITYNEPKANK